MCQEGIHHPPPPHHHVLALSQGALKPAHLIVKRDVRHDLPPIYLPAGLVFIAEAGTLGQHSNGNPDSRECGGPVPSQALLCPLNDGFGSEDDIRRESEFLFRCYSDPDVASVEP